MNSSLASRTGGALLLSVLVSCAARPTPPPPALEHVAVKAPPPEAVARWRPIALPPRKDQLSLLGFVGGSLVHDEVGARWFFPDAGGGPEVAPELVTEPLLHRTHDVRGGLVAITQGREIRIADHPLDVYRSLGVLPEDALPESVVRHRDAITFVTRNAAGTATIHRWTDAARDVVPGPPGYLPKQIAIGPDGVGAGLFLPESVHVTRDHGATWTPIKTADLRVTSVLADGPRILLLPGGVRDDFARALDPATLAIERVELRVGTKDTPRARRTPLPPPWRGRRFHAPEELELAVAHGEMLKTKGASPTMHRWHDLGGVHGLVATDGDDVLVVDRERFQPRLLLRGRLGEGVRPIGEGELEGCEVVSAALCDDLAAIACKGRVFVFRGTERIDRFAVEGPTELAFDAASHLLTVSRDEQGGTTRLRVLDLGGGEDRETREVFEKDGARPRFVGGCHRPGLWLANEQRAARWARDGFEAPVSLPGKMHAMAVASDGALLLSDSQRLLRFPDGPETLLGPHERGHLSFADDGAHGLFVAESGQVQQTDDGGATFTPIESPPSKERLSVRCGGTRCQLGSGAFREGFVREQAPVASWPPPPAATATRPKAPPEASPDLPIFMRCRPDPTIFVPRAVAPNDRADAPLQALWPRLGNTLFVGGLQTEEGGSFGVFGALGGAVERVSLPRAAVSASAAAEARRFDSRIEHSLQVVGAVGMSRSIAYGERAQAPMRWSARGPTFSVDLGEGEALAEPALIDTEGIAVRRWISSELLVLGPHAPERRLYLGSSAPSGDGVLQVLPEGQWLVAETPTPTTLRLARMNAAGAPQSVDLQVREAGGEHGIGFGPLGTDQLVILEESADGSHELRHRLIGVDLSLGRATPVPGARAPADQRLELPACSARPSGGLVRLRDPRPTRASVGGQTVDGFINRLVRIAPDGACVERTVLARTDASLDALLVIAGNEGQAASAVIAGGLSCAREATLRSSRATTGSSATPPPAGSSASPRAISR